MIKPLHIFIFVLLISSVSAQTITYSKHNNLQFRDTSGNIETGTFELNFSMSTSNDCSASIFSHNQTFTTDSTGIISYDIPSVTVDYNQQLYLCIYKDGTLRINSTITPVPYSEFARNTTWSGISGIPGTLINESWAGNQFVNRSGDTMTGNLNLGGNNLTNIGRINTDSINSSSYLANGGVYNFDSTTGGLSPSTTWFFDGTLGITYLYNSQQIFFSALNTQFSGNGTFSGTSLTVDGNEVCQSDGTNCLPGGNSSFNQSLTDTLYAGIEWDYNQTTPANSYTDTQISSINTTGNIQNLLNSTGVYSTYNATYDQWAYNQSDGSYNSTYANLLGQQCPSGEVVNGTLANGTFTCITDATGGGGGVSVSGELLIDVDNNRNYTWYNGTDLVTAPAMRWGSLNTSIGTDALVLDYNRNGTDGPEEFPIGFYTQPTESDAGVQGGDWLYDGSIVWGINPQGDNGNYRHFQMSTFFDGSYASFRVKNATNNNWLSWRLFAVDNAVAEFTFGGDMNVEDDVMIGGDGEPESDVKLEIIGDDASTTATQILLKNPSQGDATGIQFEAWTTCSTSHQELGKIFTRFTGCQPTTGEMVFQVPYGNFGSNGVEEAMWIRNTEIEMNNTLQVGNSGNSLNITMFSPDGSEWTCGVNNSGSWSCS